MLLLSGLAVLPTSKLHGVTIELNAPLELSCGLAEKCLKVGESTAQ